jgi:hypothetical protein
LNESHERSVSPNHWSDGAETDDDGNEVEQASSGTASKNQSYDSTSSSPATPRSQVNTSGSSSQTTTPLKPESSSRSPRPATEGNWTTYVVVAIGIVFIVLAVFLSKIPNGSSNPPTSTIKKCDGFFKLSTNYPSYGQDVFLSLKFGVEDLLNKDPCRPSVFLFVHDGEIRSFINQVVAETVKCLQTAGPILLSSQDFKNPEMKQDYGSALAKYKEPLEESSILVVYDLDDVPGVAAQAFHTICDTYNPLVEKAIILLTLRVTKNQINATENANEIAEMKLKQGWVDLADDKLEPLIARVTDQVFVLKS